MRLKRLRAGACTRAAAVAAALAMLAPAAAAAVADGTAYYGDPIPAEMDALYLRGLGWLARNQSPDGSWEDVQSNDGVVALAMLAMLAHGDDPNGGPWSAALRRSLEYILGKQDSSTGYIGSSMYNHGLCTLALAEAYGQIEDERIGPALRKAVELILSSQARNPLKAWRYSPEAQDADTTVSGAQMVALFAARNAGLAVPDAAIEGGVAFYKRCMSASGGFGYTTGDGSSSPARSAIGTLVLALSREKRGRAFKAAFDTLSAIGSSQQDDGHFHYYLYYAAQAYFQASPADWREWNAANLERLAATQEEDGGWSGGVGRTFATACSLLSLGVNYRFLPIYER